MSNAAQSKSYGQRSLDIVRSTLASVSHLLDDESVNEIQINAPNVVFVRKGAKDLFTNIKISATEIKAAIQTIAAINEKEISTRFSVTQEERSKSMLSARLPGLRIEGILDPVAVNGPSMCIRKHSTRVFTLGSYVDSGILTPKTYELLRGIAQRQESLIIAGSTYSGKTTLVNAFINEMPDEDRLFVIEQVHELLIKKPNMVITECDPDQGVTAQHALMSAMRYSPSRIIIGELRGKEAINFLEACNTGHAGLTTLHADSARDCLMRLEDLVMQANRGIPLEAVRARIATSITWVLHIGMYDGKREIREIYRVDGMNRDTNQYNFTNFSTGEADE
jgi:pilus assembly protein CpaF